MLPAEILAKLTYFVEVLCFVWGLAVVLCLLVTVVMTRRAPVESRDSETKVKKVPQIEVKQ